MRTLVKILLNTIAVVIGSYIIPGVWVESFKDSLIVAIVLAILNALVKPVLVFITIPVTIVTFGIFLLVINAIIIMIADSLIPGFHVSGFWSALFFSFVLSIINAIFNKLEEKAEKNND